MKKIIYSLIFLTMVSLVLAAPLQINNLNGASYTGTMTNSLYGDVGTIHFISGNFGYGMLHKSNVFTFIDGSNQTDNLEIYFAEHPTADQTYSSGDIFIAYDSANKSISTPFVDSSIFNRFYVGDDEKLYHDAGLTQEYQCLINTDCDDGSALTVDTCISKTSTQSYCVSGVANLEGTVTDTNTGAVIAGANISFYDTSVYDLDEFYLTESGNIDLQPKAVPDVVTDADGNYSIYLPPDVFYHMVVQHSKQTEYNIKTNNSKKTKHNPEMKENEGDLNVNGHILYSGNYRNGNKYVVGDVIKFIMFGRNKGGLDKNVSFLIEDHTSPGANGPWVYNGSFSNPDELLTIPNDNSRVQKKFEINIPSNMITAGKYDLHVLYDGVKGHKIGNFFIMDVDSSNRTSPTLKFETSPGFYTDVLSVDRGAFPNETFNVGFRVQVPPNADTINDHILFLMMVTENPCEFGPEGDELTISAPGAIITHDGTNYSDEFKINITNAKRYKKCEMNVTFEYPEVIFPDTGSYPIEFTVKEEYYEAISLLKQVNASIYATEQQARDIYFDITEVVDVPRPVEKFENFTNYYNGDHCFTSGGYCASNTEDVYRINAGAYAELTTDLFSTNGGFEYRTPADGYDAGSLIYPNGAPAPCESEPEVNGTGVTDCERDALNNQWFIDEQVYYILVLDPMTPAQVAQEVIDFAEFIIAIPGII